MKVLILGHSRIVQKRILPAFKKFILANQIEVASRRGLPEAQYSDYEIALKKSDADLVYVSGINSEHHPWAERALLAGKHVIVDKPAFLSLADSQRLVALASQLKLCLAEATVYSAHPQIACIKKQFQDRAQLCSRLSAVFSVPPFEAGNFRFKKESGGGALWDLGPYVVSIGRVFFDAKPESVHCRVLTKSQDLQIDTAFSVLFTYSNGRSMVGHFGFDTEYRNSLNVLGPSLSVSLDQVFTLPDTKANVVRLRHRNEEQVIEVAAADSFELFFKDVATAIEAKSFSKFYESLLTDAVVLHKTRESAYGNLCLELS